jgi:hypothetical protein
MALKTMLLGGLVGGCPKMSPAVDEQVVSDVPMRPCNKYDLQMAMSEVECEGILEKDRWKARGLNGELGPLQITKQYVDDVNRIVNRPGGYCSDLLFSYKDREYKWHSLWMVDIYWRHYATKERLGHEPTLEDLARIHNGGPNGWKKESTKPYWAKVKRELERGNNG